MLTRDTIQRFIDEQFESGLSESEAKDAFTIWLMSQGDIIATSAEKKLILADLGSYTVKKP